MKPLYIWAGGKNKMLKHYTSELKALHDFDTFVEPFFGGGAMTIHIYQNFKDVKRFVINDIKPEIIRIYQSIKNDCDRFLELMDEYDSHFIPLNQQSRKEYYYETRRKHAYEYETMSSTEEAACLYFLLRTCFNGVWQINQNTNGRFGTPSGLLDQKVSVYEKSNILEWNVFLQKADLHTGDWKEISEIYKGEKTFFFFDPPYRDSFTSYGGEFGDSAQEELVFFCNNLIGGGGQAFLTNRDSGDKFFDSRISKEMTIKRVNVVYTAGRRKKVENGFEAKPAVEVLIHTPLKENGIF